MLQDAAPRHDPAQQATTAHSLCRIDWSIGFAEEFVQPLRVGVQMENGGTQLAEQVITLARRSGAGFQPADETHHLLALLAQQGLRVTNPPPDGRPEPIVQVPVAGDVGSMISTTV